MLIFYDFFFVDYTQYIEYNLNRNVKVGDEKKMGYFKDAFDIGAGATLGNLAVNTGAKMGADFVQAKFQQAYNHYRTQYFDPVIRNDLNELLVFGRLPQIAYPFPDSNKPVKKENFFKRHKTFTVLLIVLLFLDLFASFSGASGNTGSVWQSFMIILSLLVFILFIAGIVMLVSKAGRKGKDALSSGYKKQLESNGQQYWYVREYIRQALARGEMDTKSAIVKISNTALAQQFPDTVDEIEANAFYYRQKLGMC